MIRKVAINNYRGIYKVSLKMGIPPSFHRSNNPEWDQDNSLCPWKIREMDLSEELMKMKRIHFTSIYLVPTLHQAVGYRALDLQR